MRPELLEAIVTPSDPQLSPDGLQIAYVVTRPDVARDRYHRHVEVWCDGVSRPVTQGPADSTPRWSPDGSRLAMLRTDSDTAKAQVHVLTMSTGEPSKVTEFPLGAREFQWAPDGRHLIVAGRHWLPEWDGLDPEERARRPRRITRLPYRADGDGWLHDRETQLRLVDAVTGTSRVLPSLGQHPSCPSWHPAGDRILFLTQAPDQTEGDAFVQPHEIRIAEETVRPSGPAGLWKWTGYRPDGSVHLVGLDDPYSWPDVQRVYRCAEQDAGWALTDLTGHLDRDVIPSSLGFGPPGPRFTTRGFLTTVGDRGQSRIVHVLDSGESEESAPDAPSVTGLTADAEGSRIAFTTTTPDSTGDLWLMEGPQSRHLVSFGGDFVDNVGVRETRHTEMRSDTQDLDVWTVVPEGFDTSSPRSVPVVLSIHGGPNSEYGRRFSEEFQVIAGDGYLVIATNPRGSAGRGASWSRAVVGTWDDPSSIDFIDFERVVDETLTRYPQADPSRVAVMGGSYGGFAAARLLARSSRFRAAILERGVYNWESFAGTSDVGLHFDRMYFRRSTLDDPTIHTHASVVRHAEKITTPSLILHSESDFTCPMEQAEQLLTVLRRRGTEAELVRFPGEGHDLSRTGTPRHRLERWQVILEWLARHLR